MQGQEKSPRSSIRLHPLPTDRRDRSGPSRSGAYISCICIAQLDIEPARNVPLPQIILGIDLRLDLLVSGNALSGSIECRPHLLDLP